MRVGERDADDPASALEMTEPATRFWARTTRGIEWIAAAEAEERVGATVVSIGHRDVLFDCEADVAALSALHGVDDVYVVCATVAPATRHRETLGRLGRAAREFELGAAIATIREARRIPARPRFDVVASVLGKRNYSRFEIEEVVGSAVEAATGWRFSKRTATTTPGVTDVTLRVHLADTTAIVGLRAAAHALHRRPYRVASRQAALHPPVAFAAAALAGLRPHARLLDSFCGVGTIPIEASAVALHVEAAGCDIDEEAVRLARANAQRYGISARFTVADAAKLPFDASTFDRAATNPPWGQQAQARGGIAGGLAPAFREFARVLVPRGRAVVIGPVDAAAQLADAGLNVAFRTHVSLRGSHVWLWLATLHTSGEFTFDCDDAHLREIEPMSTWSMMRRAEALVGRDGVTREEALRQLGHGDWGG